MCEQWHLESSQRLLSLDGKNRTETTIIKDLVQRHHESSIFFDGKNKVSTSSDRNSTFDPSLDQPKESANIYMSHKMSCHFLVYGPPANPTQMLAARHLHAERAFSMARKQHRHPPLNMVTTPCTRAWTKDCDKCLNNQCEKCLWPRTWYIGQRINFASPYFADGSLSKFVTDTSLSNGVWWMAEKYHTLANAHKDITKQKKQK